MIYSYVAKKENIIEAYLDQREKCRFKLSHKDRAAQPPLMHTYHQLYHEIGKVYSKENELVMDISRPFSHGFAALEYESAPFTKHITSVNLGLFLPSANFVSVNVQRKGKLIDFTASGTYPTSPYVCYLEWDVIGARMLALGSADGNLIFPVLDEVAESRNRNLRDDSQDSAYHCQGCFVLISVGAWIATRWNIKYDKTNGLTMARTKRRCGKQYLQIPDDN